VRIAEAVALVSALLSLAVPPPAAAGDGGSATYTARGATYDFKLTNTGSTAWQYFSIAAPSGFVFVGGTTSVEASARCVVGPPSTIVCGPLSTYGLPPGASIGFTGVLQAPTACGEPFALAVSATGVQPFTPAGDAVFVGECVPPRVLRAVTVRRVGRIVTLSPPAWSTMPELVVYRWQRCTRAGCMAIRGTTGRRVRMSAVVRAVVTATFADGTVLRSISRKV
jgi:hypothetical protein